MFNWVKKSGKSTVDYGKKIVNADGVKETSSTIKDLASIYLNPKKTIENSRKETFEEAKRRLSVNDIDLIKVYKNLVWSFYISLFFTLLCFIGFIYASFIAKSIMQSLAMLSIMSVCLINAFKFSFRSFQIRHKKLCSVKEWWDRANDWFPSIK